MTQHQESSPMACRRCSVLFIPTLGDSTYCLKCKLYIGKVNRDPRS